MMNLTLNADPRIVNTLDPSGELRRAGKLDLSAVPVAVNTSGDGAEWTHKTATLAFRVCTLRNRLYRRETGPQFFGGYCVKYVSLGNERIVREWLS